MRRFLCLAGFLLSLSWVVSAQPPIEVIYLNPSDVASPTEADINSLREVMVAVQTFFASEMERYGFGPKTFDFNPDIKVIMGREKAAAYDNVAVIRNEVHRLDYSVPNKIDVVFLAGKKDILNKRASGVMNALCWRQPGEDSEDCNYLGVIALENPFYFLPVVAHEIAHAFKIDHSPDTLPGRVNLMNAPHTVQIGVREDLSKYGIRREDAAFLNEDGRLSIQQSTLTTSDDQNYIQLTFSVERGDAIKPINRSVEWDGWTAGVWEKRPDGQVGKMPIWYYEFVEMDDLSHWMYSHAPSTLKYDISNREVASFGSYFLAIHTGCGPSGGSMEFIAYADNVKIYSKAISLDDSGTYIAFDIPVNTRMFRIEVGDLGNQNCDHYILGEPRFYQDRYIAARQEKMNADVNNDGVVDLADVKIVRNSIKNPTAYDTDLNDDGKIDEVDVLIVKGKAVEAIVAAAPRKITKQSVKLTSWSALKEKK